MFTSTLHQTSRVPAGGSTRFRFAYAQGYTAASVAKLATLATHTFANCVAPKVVGKTLTAAKSAIAHGACTVGKIRSAFSATGRRGR